MSNQLLLPTDFSDAAAIGVRAGGALASQLGATVTLVHVWDRGTLAEPPATLGWSAAKHDALVEEVRGHLEQRLEATRELIPEGIPVKTRLLVDHSPARAITELASKEGFALIVVATHGRTGVGRFLLGSVAEKIIRLADTRVLTVPARD